MRHGRAHRVISRARGTPGAPPRSEQGVPAAAGAAFGGPYGPELGPPTAALAAAFGGGPGFARAPRVSHIAQWNGETRDSAQIEARGGGFANRGPRRLEPEPSR